eukprot:jgi/Mesvir1/16953/Mv15804-RA.1
MMRSQLCFLRNIARVSSTPEGKRIRCAQRRSVASPIIPLLVPRRLTKSSLDNAGSFVTLDGISEFSLEVKKSRFVAYAARTENEEEAELFFDELRDPGASHNCWAYQIGAKYRFSDDGEPGGTAGRPILSAIQGAGLDEVAVLVVRYFGGTKLGTGGLVRAYGAAALGCLQAARHITVYKKVLAMLDVPFDSIGRVYSMLQKYGGEKVHEDYGTSGMVSLTLSLAAGDAERMREELRDATMKRWER